ncbi:c-type cytochrome [Tropicibacter naphthalenivorans]|uniref:Cytochrome c2 n=1 Tax=Tropicibacter naphthalenivorans TaxID=441103 RepID=A0A0P1GW10_9RHOB|nr:c-type cytochrome [Tropicibacter naphthalenivorans]CUH80758.1 Cytochrome c2 precursor [Tropicibacter naphthalenivorans]SMC90049.1 cytochrome c [Tropicibacter naphthalenivorans]
MKALLTALMLCAGVASAQEFTTLKGHGGPIMDIAVSRSGQVATASFDNSVGLWDGAVPQWLEGHEAAVNAVVHWGCGPDGTGCGVFSAGDDFAVRSLGGPDPRVLGRHKGKVTDLALSPGGGLLASASWDGTIGLWSLSGTPSAHLDAPGGVNAVAFESPSRLYAGTSNGVLMRYDLTKAEALPVVQHGFGINELVVTGDWIAYGAVDGGTRIIDQDGAEIADFTLDRRPILALAYHAETHQLAVGDGEGYIMIIDTANWRIARDFRATRRGPVWALAFSPDGAVIWAGGLDDVAYGWPVALLDAFEPGIDGQRSFLRAADTMPNGERQFMRKCSICHALTPGPSRKAGPTLYGVFGRRAGSLPGYSYSQTLQSADFTWSDATIDALFDQGPDHYIPGSKMPMQVIAGANDRADLIAFLKQATTANRQE